MQKRRKQPFTLMEIMIVIFLIGLIGGVIAYNMKGSLDEGRYFQSQQAIRQVQEVLELEIARGATVKAVSDNPGFYIKRSGIIKNLDKVMKDGWGNEFEITVTDDGKVEVMSDKFKEYDHKRNEEHKEIPEKPKKKAKKE